MRRFLTYCVIAFFLIASPVSTHAAGLGTSSKTTSNIITEVRYLINESTASHWTDAELIVWISQGVRDIVATSHCLQDTARIQLVTGTSQYAWTGVSSYITIDDKALYYAVGSSKYKHLTRNDAIIGKTALDGSPEYWWEHADKVYVWPTPTSAYAGNTVYFPYVPLPANIISSASAIVTPAIYDECLIYYVTAQALLKDKRYLEAEYYLKKYESKVNRYRADFISRPKESTEEAKPK